MSDRPYTIAEGAIGLHETYKSFVAAGFTEEQAYGMVVAILTASIGGEAK